MLGFLFHLGNHLIYPILLLLIGKLVAALMIPELLSLKAFKWTGTDAERSLKSLQGCSTMICRIMLWFLIRDSFKVCET